MEKNMCGGTSYFVDIAWCFNENKIEGNTRTLSMEIRKCTQHAAGIFLGDYPSGTTIVFSDSNCACSGCGATFSNGHASE
jgi:hypothetical protein